MKTKTLLGTLAIIGLLVVSAGAQITVSTAVTNGLNEPYNAVEDTNGNIYISDSANDRIVRIDAGTQAATTLAGVMGVAGSNDGPASGFYPALFNDPQGLLPVKIGGVSGLLVSDSGNGLIRFVRFSDGYTVTLAGNTNTLTGAVNAAGTDASFNQPIGMDQDTNGNVYIADEINNTIRVMNLNDPAFGVTNLVLTGTTLHHPTAVAFLGTNYNLLWVADSGNNAIKLITLSTPTTGSLTTYMGGNRSSSTGTTDSPFGPNARFNLPSGLLWINGLGLLISDTGNNSIRLATNNPAYGATNYAVVTFAGTPPTAGSANGSALLATFWSPEGLCQDPAFGAFLVADLKNNLIRRITTGLPLPPPQAPAGLAATAGYGQINLTWTASSGATNYNIYRTIGGPYNLIASTAATTFLDTNVNDGTVYGYVIKASNAGGEGLGSDLVFAIPLYSPSPILSVTGTGFGLVSLAWSPSAGATTYNVFRSPSHGGPYTSVGGTNAITSTSYNDTSVVNGTTYYYVVTAANPGGQSLPSNEVVVTVPIPPPPAPSIGWFDYEGFPTPVTVFYPISGTPYITHNDLLLAIEPNANGVSTLFTANGANPITNGSTPPPYQNSSPNTQTPLPVLPAPDLTIEAANTNAGGSSAIVTAEFIFQVGTPSIIGNNAAHFAVSDVTLGATLRYTTDGSDPRTNGTVVGPISITNSSIMLSLPFPANTNAMLFQIVGSRGNYLTSSIVSVVFSFSNYVPNKISFGFGSGPGSSHLVASPGQAFMAPVALTLNDPSVVVESLQFDLTATNIAGSHPINPAAGFLFYSMLVKPYPQQPSIYIPIPTWSFVTTNAAPPLNDTNLIHSYYPYGANPTTNNEAWYQNMQLTNLSENLLGVGWLELHGKDNLYNTLSQDLITYSLFGYGTSGWENLLTKPSVILGGYSFVIPSGANTNDVYQIRITRPSGSGYPNGAVYIKASTNTDASSVSYGSISAIKNVTIGQLKYIVGDVYQAPWYNAGDFGSSSLINEDVQIVFNAATENYWLNIPPLSTDLYDALDSCGNLGTYDSDPADVNYGYYTNNNQAANINPVSIDGFTPNTTLNNAQLNGLFDGNDTSINQIVFGDGILDVCDIYVTYRRSLDPSLTWYRRFWNNGHRVADTTANVFVSNAAKQSSGGKIQAAVAATPGSITNTPKVNFTAGDIQTTAGQTVHIPVTAAVFGTYPLRVAMLNISVVPLDGSPALASAISFSTGALGSPYTTASSGNNNYAAAWLNSAIAGVSNSAIIGTLNITVPANATSSSAYAVHFDHASGSPNGLASLPKHTLTGLITLSSRSTSTYNDGIPDSWRLRWFGTVNNQLSVSNACPSGDGVNNWLKYAAGVDPNTANDFPGLKPNTPPPSGAHASIYWPTVSGKQYVILSSASLFPGTWTTNATVTGNGGNMLYNDSSAGAVKFYQVLILP